MPLQKLVNKLDYYQKRTTYTSFAYAVIKKYGDDLGGYKSALISYYAVLSIFPLLFVLTSIAKIIFRNDPSLRHQISQSITRYFPIVGEQIERGIHSNSRTGVLLFFTLLLSLYGARGVAGALQYCLSSAWRIPKVKRPAFLQSLGRSISIILIGGIGLILASLISGYVVHLGNSTGFKTLGVTVSLLVIWLTLIGVFKLAIAGNKSISEIWRGAALAAVLIQIFQLLGNIILEHYLNSLNTRYGVFGLAIGLILWLYLQAQVIMLGVEVDVVRHYHLYPRSIVDKSD